LKTLTARRKRPTPSSFSENQLSDHVTKFVPSGSETGTKLHQKFFTYRPMLNMGANVCLRAVPCQGGHPASSTFHSPLYNKNNSYLHIENVTSTQKTTDTIVFFGEPAVRSCNKVRSKWFGNWYKITSKVLYVYRPKLNMGANVCLRAVPY
jgi:hypothetical protein